MVFRLIVADADKRQSAGPAQQSRVDTDRWVRTAANSGKKDREQVVVGILCQVLSSRVFRILFRRRRVESMGREHVIWCFK